MGWLTNSSRRDRRDRPNTLTDKKAMDLIQVIGQTEYYTPEYELLSKFLRLRNQALIATNWTFFKRGGEVLNLHFSDVTWNEETAYFTFNIFKKKKRFKPCPNPNCKVLNGFHNQYCRHCGTDLKTTSIIEVGENTYPVVKEKTLAFPFISFIVAWIDNCHKYLNPPEYAYIFPPVYSKWQTFNWFNWNKRMTIQNYDHLLQEADKTLTSCHFRYGGAEKHLRLGYNASEVANIGDWDSDDMPLIYARRKGLTQVLKQFRDDKRTIQ